MSPVTLAQAEMLHDLIGEAAIAVGLRARYLGPLAYPVTEGQSPFFRPSVWLLVRRNEADDDYEEELVLAGEEMFRISVAADGAADASESWNLAMANLSMRLHIEGVTERGRAFLGPFKARIGAG
ncbi:MAG TPA: hypothetical protein VGW40_04360 [Allosphingosinicella sp.]|nr:hypothetical protein [Allosphingosinicella sp.]